VTAAPSGAAWVADPTVTFLNRVRQRSVPGRARSRPAPLRPAPGRPSRLLAAVLFGSRPIGVEPSRRTVHGASATGMKIPYGWSKSQRGNHSAISGKSMTASSAITWMTMKSAMPR
jgi:hypothetical protein